MRKRLFGKDIEDARGVGTLRRRLTESSGSAGSSAKPPGHVVPLDKALTRDRSLGRVSSKQVVEYCGGAVALGAQGSGH